MAHPVLIIIGGMCVAAVICAIIFCVLWFGTSVFDRFKHNSENYLNIVQIKDKEFLDNILRDISQIYEGSERFVPKSNFFKERCRCK